MSVITGTPQVTGAAISTFDATSLAAIDVSGMTIGTIAYVTSLAAPFTLTVSTAALVTNQVVAVAGVGGVRWIKVSSGGVQSVSGGVVDNTDPLNPIVNATTLAAVKTALNPVRAVTVGNVTSVTFAGLLSDTEFGYELFFDILPLGSGGTNISIRPNGDASNSRAVRVTSSGSGAPSGNLDAELHIGEQAGHVGGTAHLVCPPGQIKTFDCTWYRDDVPVANYCAGRWNNTVQVTSLVIAGTVASSILTGSSFILRKLVTP